MSLPVSCDYSVGFRILVLNIQLTTVVVNDTFCKVVAECDANTSRYFTYGKKLSILTIKGVKFHVILEM